MTNNKERLKRCICIKKVPGAYQLGSVWGGSGAFVVLAAAVALIEDWLAGLVFMAIVVAAMVVMFIVNLCRGHALVCSLRRGCLSVVTSLTDFLVIGL